MGRAMAQAVSLRPLTTESRFRARVTPCEIFGGRSGTETGFSELFGFPFNVIPPSRSILIYLGDEQ
jgi:hypothetical protein